MDTVPDPNDCASLGLPPQPQAPATPTLTTTQDSAAGSQIPISGNGHKPRGYHEPWTPEQARALSLKGVAARKEQAARQRSLKEHLLQILRTGDNAQRLALSWYNKARKGDTRALGLMLERVWPVPRSPDQAGAGKIVHLGIRLEQAGSTTTLVLGAAPGEPEKTLPAHAGDEIPHALDSQGLEPEPRS